MDIRILNSRERTLMEESKAREARDIIAADDPEFGYIVQRDPSGKFFIEVYDSEGKFFDTL